MPEPLPTTPVLSPKNALGAPATSLAGLVPLATLAITNGITLPTTTEGWIGLVLAIAAAVLGALVKHPGQ